MGLIGSMIAGGVEGGAKQNIVRLQEEADEMRKRSFLELQNKFATERNDKLFAQRQQEYNRNRADSKADLEDQRKYEEALHQRNRREQVEDVGLLASARRKAKQKLIDDQYKLYVEKYGKEAADKWLKEQDIGLSATEKALEANAAKQAVIEDDAASIARNFGEEAAKKYRMVAMGLKDKSGLSQKEYADLKKGAYEMAMEMVGPAKKGVDPTEHQRRVKVVADKLFKNWTEKVKEDVEAKADYEKYKNHENDKDHEPSLEEKITGGEFTNLHEPQGLLTKWASQSDNSTPTHSLTSQESAAANAAKPAEQPAQKATVVKDIADAQRKYEKAKPRLTRDRKVREAYKAHLDKKPRLDALIEKYRKKEISRSEFMTAVDKLIKS